jgi:hypothetical protein
MRIRKSMVAMMVLVFLASSIPVQWMWAAEGGAPPIGDNEKIQGPEIWGVIVLDTSANTATLRAKRIVDCNVETQAGTQGVNFDPTGANDLLNVRLGATGSLFSITGVPIITKVKNFKVNSAIVSCDVQIMFVVPK